MTSKKENLVASSERKPAGVNPWYVLATLFGEDVTKETSNKNSSMGEVIDRINTLLAPNASNAFNKII